MKKLTVYDVYLDDGHDALKVIVPAESKKAAAAYTAGNGDVVAIRENECIQDIDLDYLASYLRAGHWGEAEIAIITRTLEHAGLARR